ncbi:replication protein A 70 kDa DNA-binding subunit-like [Artemia franciscana]|uniref:Replication protein A subunit n=1 Tax=Artemia franciscana TaxID=6661 RepID=A0AA88L540_ARTSF|nr:hypothetical protein QYM36_006119 [Artemia franciscana]
MQKPQLTANAVKDLMEGKQLTAVILQILSTKKVGSATGAERYRALISDGTYSNGYAMLATQLNGLVTSRQLEDYSIVRVNNPIVNTVNNQGKEEKRIVVLLDLEILKRGSEVGGRVGDPVQWTPGASQAASKPQAPAPPIDALSAKSRPSGVTSDQLAADQGHIGTIFPVAALTPFQNRWTIKARVTRKSEVRTYSNARGEGKLFSIDLLDASGEIRATGFNQEVDRFYDMLELNNVYYVSGCQVKTAWAGGNTQRTTSQYELTFGNQTKISLCEMTDAKDMPTIAFDFVPIRKIEDMAKDAFVDVIGVITEVSEVSSIVARATGRELKKRELKILDTSGADISLTLWGTQAETFDSETTKMIAAKHLRVGDFGGRTLSTTLESKLILNPDMEQSRLLSSWYENQGRNMAVQSLSAQRGAAAGGSGISYGGLWKSFAEAKLEQLGGEKADYFTTKAFVTTVKTETALYMACSSPDCNRKVMDQQNGLYRCEKCNRDSPDYKWRLLLNVCLCDSTDYVWATIFQEAAEALLGISSEELGTLKQTDETGFLDVFRKVNMVAYVFKIRVKMETYNDERRLKYAVYDAKPVDYLQYSKKLQLEIEQLAKELGELH